MTHINFARIFILVIKYCINCSSFYKKNIKNKKNERFN